MKKKCQKNNCIELGYKEVLIKDKKNKEYLIFCKDHYEQYISSANTSCDWKGCLNSGEFRAPSKENDKILWFCEEHIKIYNQEWDFFDGMSQPEIEDFISEDIIGHKKTLKFGSKDNFFKKLWDNAIDDDFLSFSKLKKDLSDRHRHFDKKQIAALKKMELKEDASWFVIKEQFKKLVKKYHPDMNNGDKKHEEKLKEITIAYSYLKNSITVENKKNVG